MNTVGREEFTFASLPKNLEEMQALPEAGLDSPFKTAALAVCALCTYSADNNYKPDEPFRIVIESNQTSDAEEGYKKLFIPCGGADSPRPVKLRQKGDGRWFLWEQYLLTAIRQPKAEDPWA